jgi:hypothetical protein
MRARKLNRYGCPDCGSTSFHDTSGHRIEAVADVAGAPRVSRKDPNALDFAEAAFLDMNWSCERGHQVKPLSAVWTVLEAASALPLNADPIPLPDNEQG